MGASREASALQEEYLEVQVPDVGRLYWEDRIRGDFEVAQDHRELYKTRRGRKCEYPECSEPVRYTKSVSFCRKHDGTELAHHARTAAENAGKKGGGLPRLYGLREARLAAGLTRGELAAACGRHVNWVDKIEVKSGKGGDRDPQMGTTPTMRRHIAEVLGVSERFLLEGSPKVSL